MNAVLGLDTASDDTAVAVVSGDHVIFDEIRGPDSGRPLHGPALLEMVEQAVAKAGGWLNVQRILVGTGPGSFTGLRVGLATAKALAKSAGIPIGGVCTLDTLAAGAIHREFPGPFLAALDARRGQIFAALYQRPDPGADGSGAGVPLRLSEPFVCDPDELTESLGERLPAIAAGSGALRFREQLEAAGITVPGPEDLVHRVSARWTVGVGEVSEQSVEPIYLRAPDAERWRERDRPTGNIP